METQSNDAAVPDLRLLREREPRAVERWFLEHADALYTFVYYRVDRDEGLAEDVVQETFLAALRRIGEYDPGRGAMLPWLTYTARNCIRSALRRRRRTSSLGEAWGPIDAKLAAAFRELDAAPLPDEAVQRRETAELVQMALAHIPENYRSALRSHYCGGRSLEEIAAAEGTTSSAVKSLLHRARLAFKAAFQTIAGSLEQGPPERRVHP
jgi:RNA polymerase sigma factor (sigma-70 family)